MAALALLGSTLLAAFLFWGLCSGICPPQDWVSTLGVEFPLRFTVVMCTGAVLVTPFLWSTSPAGWRSLLAHLAVPPTVLGLILVAFFDMVGTPQVHVLGATMFFGPVTVYAMTLLRRGLGWNLLTVGAVLACTALLVAITAGFLGTYGVSFYLKGVWSNYVTLLTSTERTLTLDTIRFLEWIAVLSLILWIDCLALGQLLTKRGRSP